MAQVQHIFEYDNGYPGGIGPPVKDGAVNHIWKKIMHKVPTIKEMVVRERRKPNGTSIPLRCHCTWSEGIFCKVLTIEGATVNFKCIESPHWWQVYHISGKLFHQSHVKCNFSVQQLFQIAFHIHRIFFPILSEVIFQGLKNLLYDSINLFRALQALFLSFEYSLGDWR